MDNSICMIFWKRQTYSDQNSTSGCLWFAPSPESVSVSARLSFSPGTDAGLNTRPSVTPRAEGLVWLHSPVMMMSTGSLGADHTYGEWLKEP